MEVWNIVIRKLQSFFVNGRKGPINSQFFYYVFVVVAVVVDVVMNIVVFSVLGHIQTWHKNVSVLISCM